VKQRAFNKSGRCAFFFEVSARFGGKKKKKKKKTFPGSPRAFADV
jgi:hypothetical protein